ncbi:hypothetical protein NMB32_18875 [Stenotrophomonas sp. CD2]|nr:hypothetical protein NMB32_18875 [Stenotrophomonas sp. CD2]
MAAHRARHDQPEAERQATRDQVLVAGAHGGAPAAFAKPGAELVSRRKQHMPGLPQQCRLQRSVLTLIDVEAHGSHLRAFLFAWP